MTRRKSPAKNVAAIADAALAGKPARGLFGALGYRERQDVLAEGAEDAFIEAPGAPAPTPQELARRISPRAIRLIVDFETGGKSYYKSVIKERPIWPAGASGVTIGFGYDLGYVSLAEYRRDWAALIATLNAGQRTRMEACIGKHGGAMTPAAMKALCDTVKDVVVGWDVSEAVFVASTVPKFAQLTYNALKNCAELPGDCFGVLVSLTFNRGASYAVAKKPTDTLDRYREMRAIRQHMAARAFDAIPAEILAMIRIWKGTKVEAGLARRRQAEAELFAAGLAVPAPVEGVARLALAVDTTPEQVSDEDHWRDITEDDLVTTFLEAPVAVAGAGVRWAEDKDSPDYNHLGALAQGVSFALTAADLELLAQLNDWALDAAGDTPVLFGLRGAGIVKSHKDAGGIVLIDQRPDHRLPRCVLGVWRRATGKVSVFPASTVPNAAAVSNYYKTKKSGNLMPTGLYQYACGPHSASATTPGCFLLRKPNLSEKRMVVVRRSVNNLWYDLADSADPSRPGNNIHPAFFSNPIGFSSFGCQVVQGTFKAGSHSGPWAEFRKAAGFTDIDGEPGKPFIYLLVTGAEARLAAKLRTGNQTSDPLALRSLRRIRAGACHCAG